jgi:hypothetical protein
LTHMVITSASGGAVVLFLPVSQAAISKTSREREINFVMV